jgi:phosphatidylglycerophosphatase A
MKSAAILLATAGGAGYAPIAPGTFGSAVGAILYLVMRGLGLGASWEIGLLAAVTVLGVWASTEAARHFGREDPGYVVIDEVAGQLATYLLLDLSWVGVTIGFLLFRIFDIIKPWPAGKLESLHGGWGIMADDLMAGVYGWLVLAAIVSVIPALR